MESFNSQVPCFAIEKGTTKKEYPFWSELAHQRNENNLKEDEEKENQQKLRFSLSFLSSYWERKKYERNIFIFFLTSIPCLLFLLLFYPPKEEKKTSSSFTSPFTKSKVIKENIYNLVTYHSFPFKLGLDLSINRIWV